MPHFVIRTLRRSREDAEFARANSLLVRKEVSLGCLRRSLFLDGGFRCLGCIFSY
jgi:hypothetical protein